MSDGKEGNTMNVLYLVVGFVILQRLIELWLAKKNEKHLLTRGAVEAGGTHYPYLVTLHTLFLVCLVLEVWLMNRPLALWWWIPLGLFAITQLLRVWILLSLGRFWNTKILVLPGAPVIKRGPYRWVRHPNYVIVVVEFILLPLMFQAYISLVLFSVLNAVMLSIRIPAEEAALKKLTDYEHVFLKK